MTARRYRQRYGYNRHAGARRRRRRNPIIRTFRYVRERRFLTPMRADRTARGSTVTSRFSAVEERHSTAAPYPGLRAIPAWSPRAAPAFPGRSCLAPSGPEWCCSEAAVRSLLDCQPGVSPPRRIPRGPRAGTTTSIGRIAHRGVPRPWAPGAARPGIRTPHQVLTSRDSPRTILPVMIAKWVCRMHFQANWKRYRGGRPATSSLRRCAA